MEIPIGFISGIVSGTGMGGGTILIFLLTFILGMEQHIAQATNLIFFIPTSISAILVNIKNKNIDYKLTIFVCVSGVIGAFIGSKISMNLEVQILRKYFGIFLAIIAIHEIYILIKKYINNKNRHTKIKQN